LWRVYTLTEASIPDERFDSNEAPPFLLVKLFGDGAGAVEIILLESGSPLLWCTEFTAKKMVPMDGLMFVV
jgi:hypothetical protein